jgi:protein gp37
MWWGVSVENQAAADERIPELLETPAAIRFLSLEPLLGPVDISEYLDPAAAPCGETSDVVDWAIIGVESGPGARDCDTSSLLSLIDQCDTARVACFVKQWRHVPGIVEAGKGSHVKGGGIIGAPYVRGAQHLAFPEVPRGR